MALLMMDGFDAGDMATKWVNGANAGSSTGTRFGAGRAATIVSQTFYRRFPAASQIFVGLACSVSNLDGTIRPYVSLYGDSGATAHLTVAYSNTALNLYRGAPGGVLLASSPGVFTATSWYSLEISATIADSGGTCVVKLNGATVINFTGDTKNGGTNTTIDALYLGANGGYAAYFDDVYVCDATGSAPYNTFLGDVRIHTLSPNGAGSSTQFTPSSGANYTTVDELPYSATDYVASGTVGQRDMYTMADLPASTGNILAVQNNAIAKRTDATAISLKTAIKSGGNLYYGSTVNLGTADSTLTDLYTVNPATTTAWTAADVNSLEAGFEVA
jgi:hypothetical protein